MISNNPVVSKVIKDYNSTQNAFLPRTVTIPLSEEIGVNYKAIVSPGDRIKEGAVIAISTNLETPSYIHSSIPGTVEDIVPCYCPNTKQGYGVKIKLGGAFSYLGKNIEEENIDNITTSFIEKEINNNGIVNTFYANSPENFGFQIKNCKKGMCLVIRMFDEDPYRITDSLIAKFYSQEIIKGAAIIAKVINAAGVVFAVDQKLKHKGFFDNESIQNFRVLEMNIKRYPSGTPREIVSAFRRTGLKKSSNFEIKKTDLFIDAATAYEVYRAVCLKTPEISKPVHFSGNCLQASCLLDVRIGTPIKDIISQIGGVSKNPELVIINGDLCGSSVQNLDVPITKYVKSVKLVSNRKITDTQIYNCVNCGNCRVICPVHISPDILYNTTVNFQSVPESFAKSSLACISCGLCNTVCLARLPLCQTISVLKENVSHILEDNK